LDLANVVKTHETLTAVDLDAAAGSLTYVDERGDSKVLDLANVVKTHETLTTVSGNFVEGTLTYSDEEGVSTDLDIRELVGNGDLTVSEGIEFYAATDGVGKLLTNASVRVANGGITMPKLASQAVSASKMNADTALAGMVPTATGENGQVEYKAVPRFFYMPSVIFTTTTLATGLKRDLYQDYVNQFTGGAAGAANSTYFISHGAAGGSMPYSGGLIKNPGAASPDIVTYDKNQMDYYITYYDTSVLANVQIDDDGILTYDIIGSATVTTYMNIVFVIK
ncbi:hypothetical protein HX004_15755, partial [Myroides sp. 1354]|nr:hypothetical protein [Myroides sp. R163-1]MDM1057214.1 hypothetical protein [Myroides sp. 1354]MDM1070409.1 hypothetical protein [Myroides sp. 1372]